MNTHKTISIFAFPVCSYVTSAYLVHGPFRCTIVERIWYVHVLPWLPREIIFPAVDNGSYTPLRSDLFYTYVIIIAAWQYSELRLL